MFDTARHDEKFAGIQLHDSIAELDPHLSAPDKKKLIFVFVLMPDELTFELHQLHFLAVELADDLWAPMLGE